MRFGLPDGFMRARPCQVGAAPLSTEALAQRLNAYAEALRQLPAWMDASWLDASGLPRGVAASPALARALALEVPPADAFEHPAHVLPVLAPQYLGRLLRARALLRRRPGLRRCIDPQLQRRLAEWLHPAVFSALLLEGGVQELARDVEGLPLPPGAGAPLGCDALAWEGFCLFQREGVWTDRSLHRLIRLRFPQALRVPAELYERPGAPDGSAWVLERMGRFVPEVAWLCG